MMVAIFAQADELSAFQRGVREQFAKHGSPRDFLILWGSLIAFVILCRVIWRLQQRITGGDSRRDPRRLFTQTVKRLKLPPAERRCLSAVVRSANVDEPTSVLLSLRLFDEASDAWRKRRASNASNRDREEHLLTSLRQNLFPP